MTRIARTANNGGGRFPAPYAEGKRVKHFTLRAGGRRDILQRSFHIRVDPEAPRAYRLPNWDHLDHASVVEKAEAIRTRRYGSMRCFGFNFEGYTVQEAREQWFYTKRSHPEISAQLNDRSVKIFEMNHELHHIPGLILIGIRQRNGNFVVCWRWDWFQFANSGGTIEECTDMVSLKREARGIIREYRSPNRG